jgi:uncharacterized protein involved in exopolysaccharide biosynthesis
MMQEQHIKHDQDFIELSELMHGLIEKKWLILIVTLIVFTTSTIYASLKSSTYQSSILLKIQHKQQNAVTTINNNDLTSTLGEEPLAVQIALMKSEFILRPVIQNLGLNQNKFSHTIIPEAVALSKLQNSLLITDLSGSADNNISKVAILRVAFTGTHPNEITATLNQLASTIVQKSILLKVSAAENTLMLLQHQLPIVKLELQKAENALNDYQTKIGSIDIQSHKEFLLKQLAEINNKQAKQKLDKSALLLKFTVNHPATITATQEIQALEKAKQELMQQLKLLPVSEQEVQQLKREIDVNTSLYIRILDQIHQLQVIKTGIVSDIEILSPASTPALLQPIKITTVGIAGLLIGFMIACLGVLAWRLVKNMFMVKNKVNAVMTENTVTFNTG